MRLIIKHYSGNECSYYFDWVYPVEYSSAEKLMEDFINECEKSLKDNGRYSLFKVGGVKFDVSNFIYRNEDGSITRDWPEIMTIDEWFYESEKEGELVKEGNK